MYIQAVPSPPIPPDMIYTDPAHPPTCILLTSPSEHGRTSLASRRTIPSRRYGYGRYSSRGRRPSRAPRPLQASIHQLIRRPVRRLTRALPRGFSVSLLSIRRCRSGIGRRRGRLARPRLEQISVEDFERPAVIARGHRYPPVRAWVCRM